MMLLSSEYISFLDFTMFGLICFALIVYKQTLCEPRKTEERNRRSSYVHIHDARISTSALDKVVHVLVLDSKSIFIKSSLKYLQMYVATITFF